MQKETKSIHNLSFEHNLTSKSKYLLTKLFLRLEMYELKLRSSRAESNWLLRATVCQNSSSVQMASAYHVSAAVLAHVARSGQLDSALDERSLRSRERQFIRVPIRLSLSITEKSFRTLAIKT